MAEASGLGEIATHAGSVLANGWLRVSRFREVESLMSRALAVQVTPQSLNNAGRAGHALGDRQAALTYYEQALPLHRAVGDRNGEATTLSNIGAVHNALGDRQTALTYYEQALPLTRAVGDRAGEAATRYNIAALHAASGDLAEAIAQMEIVVDLDRAIGHPDLAADQQALDQYRRQASS